MRPCFSAAAVFYKQVMVAHASDTSMVRFGHLVRPVAFVDCRHLVNELPRYFRGWNIGDVSGTTQASPIITVSAKSTCYQISASWLKPSLQRGNDIDAVCALIAELIRASVDDNTDYMCLHAAASEIAGQLVVFPNAFRAGKSLLCACLAAYGCRLFADDVLPLVGPEAIASAPGVAPRLRLPLPEFLTPETRDFLVRHRGPGNSRYAYLDLPAARLFEHGERAAIDAVVMLNRQDEGAAVLEPATRSRALRQTIWQNFGRKAGPERILSRLQTAISQTAVCYRLSYSSVDEAAQLLMATFSNVDMTPPIAPTSSPPAQDRELSPIETSPAGGSYRQRTGLRETRMDGELYLADSRTGTIHQMDAVGMAVWVLLAEPTTPQQIAAELALAFPTVSRAQIDHDVGALLDTLAKKHLISMT